ncbi:MAG TPA: hypothetical protein VED01_27790 [Burkholderiales bacterium]|nr:hypothetical protein [Burkholderiales bacterium]
MSNITTQQLAQLLLGVARAQNAVIDALENSKAGFKATHFRPAIETASRIRSNQPETLADYPSRLLLQMLGRAAPDTDRVLRDLEALLAQGGGAAPAPAAAAPAAAQSAADDDNSLDMTR